MSDETERSSETLYEKRVALYQRQVRLLDEFLERGAISKAQYQKSFGDLTEKMGMKDIGYGLGKDLKR